VKFLKSTRQETARTEKGEKEKKGQKRQDKMLVAQCGSYQNFEGK